MRIWRKVWIIFFLARKIMGFFFSRSLNFSRPFISSFYFLFFNGAMKEKLCSQIQALWQVNFNNNIWIGLVKNYKKMISLVDKFINFSCISTYIGYIPKIVYFKKIKIKTSFWLLCFYTKVEPTNTQKFYFFMIFILFQVLFMSALFKFHSSFAIIIC